MITDIEISEYQNHCAALASLCEKFLKKRQELRRLLEETAALRRNAILILAKANHLTRYLNGNERYIAGLSYHPGELKARINQTGQFLFQSDMEEGDMLPEIRESFKSRRELKQKGLAVLGMIDRVKKKIFQLELLELRCKELILAIGKSLEAFRHESREIHRKIYPYGIFSIIFRQLRKVSGNTYFTRRDLPSLSALGNITCLVLKIADSPLI